MQCLNYSMDLPFLIKALDYYESLGYNPLAVPFLVDEDVVNLTLPEGKDSKKHLNLHYVGSAEQSFYQLIKDKENITPGSYMMLTPCVRDEIVSESSLEIFLKLELISIHKSREEILEDALDFYQEVLPQTTDICTVSTPEGFDININGVEVGSFGSRFIDNSWYSYGTGLALPRISYALNKLKA